MALETEEEILRKINSIVGERVDKYFICFQTKDNDVFVYDASIKGWDLLGYLDYVKHHIYGNIKRFEDEVI